MNPASAHLHPATRRWIMMTAFCGLAVLATLAGPSEAAGPPCRAWTGGGADNKWTTAANWDTGAPNAGDCLLFPQSASKFTNLNNYPEGTAFHEMKFSGGGYTINGNRVSLSAGVTNAIPAAFVTTINLRLGGAGGITNTSGWLELAAENLHFGETVVQGGGIRAGTSSAFGQNSAPVTLTGGVISLGPNVHVPNQLTIGGPANPELFGRGGASWDNAIQAAAGHATFSSEYGATLTISHSISGPATIHKEGGGTVVFASNNSFTGKVHVADGILEVAHTESLGSHLQGTLVEDGGTLRVAESFDLEPIELRGHGDEASAGALTHTIGVVLLGDVTVGADTTIEADGDILRFTNGLAQTDPGRTVTKTGAGTLEIMGTNAFNGSIDVREGTLSVRDTLSASIELNGGMLAGDGRCGPVTAHTGVLKPGVGNAGRLTIDGDLIIKPTARIEFWLDSEVTRTILRALGGVELPGQPVFGLNGAGAVPVGTSVTLLENDGPDPIDGTFGFPEGGLISVGTQSFTASYAGGTGNDLTLTRLDVSSPDATATLVEVPVVIAAGSQVAITYRARNEGPGAAIEVDLAMSGGALLQFVSLVAADGWQCTVPAVGTAGALTCYREVMAPGIDHTFVATFTVAATAGQTVTMGTVIEHATPDPIISNNGSVATRQVAPADPRPFKRILPALASDGGG